jgi:hypothetical protein
MQVGGGTRIRRNPRVVYRRMSGEEGGVLLHLDTAAYHGLNPTGSAIWERIRDGVTVAELTEDVRAVFEDAPPELDRDVTGFVSDLLARGLLEVVGGPDAPADTV